MTKAEQYRVHICLKAAQEKIHQYNKAAHEGRMDEADALFCEIAEINAYVEKLQMDEVGRYQ